MLDVEGVILMDAMMKECTKPHAIAHSIAGIGVGLLLVGLVPSLASSGLMYGIILIVGGIAWDMYAQKKK